jgi:hypothetical protein
MKTRFSWKHWAGLALGIALVGAAIFVVRRPGFYYRSKALLQQLGFIAPDLPLYIAPNAPPDRVTTRRLLVTELHQALARDDYAQAARLNAILSQEAFQRVYRALKAWETQREPKSGLLPYAASPWFSRWDASAEVGNLYPHLYIAALYLDPDHVPLWEQTMESDREICGVLPCTIELDSLTVVADDLDVTVDTASEYNRDGLLSITERFGQSGPWYHRLTEVTDAILDTAHVDTKYGLLVANSTETNGSQLQVLTRLYWATRDERYLIMAERIGDVFLFQVIPSNGGLPSDYWDFETNQPLPEDPRFRPEAESIPGVYPLALTDHGGEIIQALPELYLLERLLGRAQADRYQEPLRGFLDRIVKTGRTDEGLWIRSVDTATLQPFNNQPADTWGYLLAGLHTFDLAEGTSRYSGEIAAMMHTVSTKHSIDWEYGPQQDGYADSIESMLYLLPWFNVPEAHYWVDDEIEVMFLKQRPDGFIEGWYLDGNFVRTALLYGQYKTQGVRLDRWSERVRLGAAYDRANKTLYLYAASAGDWSGLMRFDTPRHQTVWGMPLEYPRVNAAPEWYVVEPGGVYRITNMDTGEVRQYTGQELAEGLPVTLEASTNYTLRLTVSQP